MLGFLLKPPYPPLKDVIVGALIFSGITAGVGFNLSLAYHSVEAHNCREKAREAGLVLVGKIQDKALKPGKLLVTVVMTEFPSPFHRRAWARLVRPRGRLFWLVMPTAAWVLLCLILGGYLG